MAIWQFFNKWKPRQFNGNASNLGTQNIKLLLIQSGATTPPTSLIGDTGAQFVSDVLGTNGTEVTGTNYARTPFGTMTVSAPSSGVVTVSGTSITYAQSASGFSNARYGVLADVSSGVDTTSPVIACVDFGASVGNVAGPLTISTDTGNAIFTAS